MRRTRLRGVAERLAYYDEDRSAFVVEPIEYELAVGRHSLDPGSLRARFRVVDRETAHTG